MVPISLTSGMVMPAASSVSAKWFRRGIMPAEMAADAELTLLGLVQVAAEGGEASAQ